MRLRMVLVCCVVASVAACGFGRPSVVHSEYDDQTGKLKTMTRDSNGDGRIDEWVFMDGVTAIRGEFDKDFDGKLDRWEYYKDGKINALVKVGTSVRKNGKEDAWAYSDANGQIVRIEISSKQDGKITRREYYENGNLVRAEDDTKGTGRPDKWETYAGGALATVGFDSNGDGKVDRLLTYGPNGVTSSRPK